jgi:hypothetical protein
MELFNSWYVIERRNRIEIIPHETLIDLDPTSFWMLQNFKSRQQAMSEMRRLLQNEIKVASAKVQNLERRM